MLIGIPKGSRVTDETFRILVRRLGSTSASKTQCTVTLQSGPGSFASPGIDKCHNICVLYSWNRSVCSRTKSNTCYPYEKSDTKHRHMDVAGEDFHLCPQICPLHLIILNWFLIVFHGMSVRSLWTWSSKELWGESKTEASWSYSAAGPSGHDHRCKLSAAHGISHPIAPALNFMYSVLELLQFWCLKLTQESTLWFSCFHR